MNRKCWKGFLAVNLWLACAGLPAYAWNETESARIKAAFADTIVIIPIEPVSNQPLTQTDEGAGGPVVRNVICLDTLACKQVATLAGMGETLRGNPYSLAALLELGPPDNFVFYTSSANAEFAHSPQHRPTVFFVAYPSGQALAELHGGVMYTAFYTDLKHAEEIRDLAATDLGALDIRALPLDDFIRFVASGEIANTVLKSPYRNAWWLTKWQGDNSAAIATAID